MKLDLELCRKILLEIEEKGGVNGIGEFPRISGYDDDFIFYQIKKMSEAGFVEYEEQGKSTSYEYFEVDIVFAGHEFLRHMMEDTLWSKVKEMAKRKGLNLSFELVKQLIPIAYSALLS